MSRLLLLARDADDFLDYLTRHPELKGHDITVGWPWHLERVGDNLFDKLVITAGFKSCPRSTQMIAAAQTRIRPTPVVHLTGWQAEVMGIGGSDA